MIVIGMSHMRMVTRDQSNELKTQINNFGILQNNTFDGELKFGIIKNETNLMIMTYYLNLNS